MVDDTRLDVLCERVGIALSYMGGDGIEHHATSEGKRQALAALGFAVGSDTQIADSIAAVEMQRWRALAPLVVIGADAACDVALAAEAMGWTIRREDGHVVEGHATGRTLTLPALPAGYHHITLETATGPVRATLISAPPRCYQPPQLDHGRTWGVTAQVYSLRGAGDVGVGSYADVETLARSVAARGGAFLGLSPVHALFCADASKFSPYSPSSRLFLQTSLIAPHRVPGFDPAQDGAADSADPLIDYGAVLPRQRKLLEAIWERTCEVAIGDIAAFRQAGGERLEQFATFEALSDHFKAQGLHWVGEWPTAYRDVRSSEVAAFHRDHGQEVAFHVWLQWLADSQLAAAAEAARAGGMAVGLYRDLAVGADRGGAEFWGAPDAFVSTMSVGAPPDPLGPQGQDWGLPPFHPHALEATSLAIFRDLVTSNMRHAGAIRIDHAFQLQRLFVLPSSGKADDGVYLSYPVDALLAALKIESHRARCIVIGEDLGTAPEGFSERIMDAGMMSYRLLPFERGEAGRFKAPAEYPPHALAALSTHDLPPFAGWWRGLDVYVRECLGIYDSPAARDARTGRAADRDHLRTALLAEGIADEIAGHDIAPPLAAALAYLAKTPCALVAVQIEDILGEQQQANLPGPDCGHPNWRRRLAVPVEQIADHAGLDRVAAVFAAQERTIAAYEPSVPRATYRLQLHKGFTFDDAVAIVPYLARLGISHVYSSPIQMARPGSMHGYDVVDPARINPELGGIDGFRRFSDALRAHQLGLVVDIVPNHVGVGGSVNPWWLDLLEWGRTSVHARTFDIDWEKPGAGGKLIVPFLGEPFDALLAKGDLALKFDATVGRLALWYADHCHPIAPWDYGSVLARVDAGARTDDVRALGLQFAALHDVAPREVVARGGALKEALAQLCTADDALGAAIERHAATVSGDDLPALIARQAWTLVHWSEANTRINYRRFFDITSLAGVRVEHEPVFEASHRAIFDLITEGRIQGLRVDHIDGLADPAAYLQKLQARVGPGYYIVVEKIIEPGEHLPAWPIAGTTGYDALRALDSVFFASDALPALDAIDRTIEPAAHDRKAALTAIKSDLADHSFSSETTGLLGDLEGLTQRRADALRPALLALLAAFPVYRTYGVGQGFSPQDRDALREASNAAAATLSPHDRAALDAIVGALSAQAPTPGRALRRFQQLTGPLMAKSFEDTLFYRDARFIAANEVGCGPAHPGIDAAEFHRGNEERAAVWPGSMIATATHDTKRGEDARGRLIAASHDMDGWTRAWKAFGTTPGVDALAPSDAYFLFQSLLAACPIAPDEGARQDFVTRAQAFVEKSLREGKRRSTWTKPDTAYEKSARAVVANACGADGVLFGDLAPWIATIALAGARLGIARTVLKCTVPGVPDIYQGCELADLSFVDPDNRRPVDYARRVALMDERLDLADDAAIREGRGKAFVLARLLADRHAHPATYRQAYRPLQVSDDRAAVAFVRGGGVGDLCVIARRGFAGGEELGTVSIPAGTWRNLLSEGTLCGAEALAVDRVLGVWPAAVMRRTA